MPNERTIQAKKEIVDQLKATLDSAVTCVVVDYKGISVEDDTKPVSYTHLDVYKRQIRDCSDYRRCLL